MPVVGWSRKVGLLRFGNGPYTAGVEGWAKQCDGNPSLWQSSERHMGMSL